MYTLKYFLDLFIIDWLTFDQSAGKAPQDVRSQYNQYSDFDRQPAPEVARDPFASSSPAQAAPTPVPKPAQPAPTANFFDTLDWSDGQAQG